MTMAPEELLQAARERFPSMTNAQFAAAVIEHVIDCLKLVTMLDVPAEAAD